MLNFVKLWAKKPANLAAPAVFATDLTKIPSLGRQLFYYIILFAFDNLLRFPSLSITGTIANFANSILPSHSDRHNYLSHYFHSHTSIVLFNDFTSWNLSGTHNLYIHKNLYKSRACLFFFSSMFFFGGSSSSL